MYTLRVLSDWHLLCCGISSTFTRMSSLLFLSFLVPEQVGCSIIPISGLTSVVSCC